MKSIVYGGHDEKSREDARAHVLALRGCLAFGLIFHALVKQNRVNYGIRIGNLGQKRRIAVSFLACGTLPHLEQSSPN